MYDCGDILYNKENGQLVMVIGYNADEVNEILNANNRGIYKIDTISKLDNTYVSYYALPLLVLADIRINIDLKSLCYAIVRNFKSKALGKYVDVIAYHQESMTHFEKIMHMESAENYLMKNRLHGTLMPEYYTKKDLEKKFKHV